MSETILEEWLEEFGTLETSQLHIFASEQEHNVDVAVSVFNILEERHKYAQLVDRVCSQLFEFYRTREVELQRFTLQFVPVLIRIYLGSVAQGDKRTCRSIEALLIGIYNLEIVNEADQPKAVSFRTPSIAQSSIYHEPMTLASSFLTTNSLRRLEECNTKLVSWGPLPQVEALNAQNRLKVTTALMFSFNRQLSRLNKVCLEYLCKAVRKLVNQGFNLPGHAQRPSYGSDSSSGSYVPLRPPPRIPVSSQFLLELVHALYFAVFNGQEYPATQAIAAISRRAQFENFPDVQLLANAVQHSLKSSLSAQSHDRPMGVNYAVSTTMSKSIITNASFRIKKLPEDIPIQNKDETSETKNLNAITEEDESGATPADKQKTTKQLPGQKSLPKLPTFSGLGKKLNTKPTKQQNGGEIITAQVATGVNNKNRNSLVEEIKNETNLELNETEKVSLVSDSIGEGGPYEDEEIVLVNMVEKEGLMQVSAV